MHSNTGVRSPSQDPDGLPAATQAIANQLIHDGHATSISQAAHMAAIALDNHLSLFDKQTLLVLAKRIGADFDPALLTPEQVREASNGTRELAKQLALLVGEPAGEA